jgi:hypothetical protein
VECADGHDHSRRVRDHPAGREACGQEVRRYVASKRHGELLEIQVDQWHTQNLRIRDPDRVERDIDAARLTDDGLQMLVDSLLVERVNLRRLSGSTGGNDVLGNRLDRCTVMPSEKNLSPLVRKGACDSTADPTAGSVDHRHLVLENHLWLRSMLGWSHAAKLCPTSRIVPNPSMMHHHLTIATSALYHRWAGWSGAR